MHLDVVWDTLYGKYTSQRQLSYGMLFVLFLPLWVKSSFHRYFTLHTYMHSVAYQENSKGGGWLPYMVKTIIFHMVDAVEFMISCTFPPSFSQRLGQSCTVSDSGTAPLWPTAQPLGVLNIVRYSIFHIFPGSRDGVWFWLPYPPSPAGTPLCTHTTQQIFDTYVQTSLFCMPFRLKRLQ